MKAFYKEVVYKKAALSCYKVKKFSTGLLSSEKISSNVSELKFDQSVHKMRYKLYWLPSTS